LSNEDGKHVDLIVVDVANVAPHVDLDAVCLRQAGSEIEWSSHAAAGLIERHVNRASELESENRKAESNGFYQGSARAQRFSSIGATGYASVSTAAT
jgi:hypothetical protein